ncbi:hypothetical protein JQX13_05250 [Archangium violaceum]|uniref:hypothetical protein n=1 Tax=Archangium violaceum TaxID=83451 RepID=UPI00193BF11C|nr:hypothetical protein [Archangium violaceum]QRK09545.1 hypothetical protein JQX13_05250 [Archangium violaceum]
MSREEEDFHRRWREGADSLARLYVSLLDASYTQYEREFLVLQRRLLSTCETSWEQLETRRRVAEELLMGAYSRGVPWADFGRALKRIRRLGYSNVERRVHVAILFARWSTLYPEHRPAARRLLDVAERHFLAAPRDVPLYESMRQSLELIRRDPGFERPSRS